MIKQNTGRKVTVIRDELGVTGGGLYAVLPFDNIDKDGKAVFKIGLASNFSKRMEGYMTMQPKGLRYIAFLENPKKDKTERGEGGTRTVLKPQQYYYKIEQQLIKDLIKNGAERITSTARVKGLNEKNEGETELFYTNADTIHKSFELMHSKFGGKAYYYNTKSVNSERVMEEKKDPTFVGKIIFV